MGTDYNSRRLPIVRVDEIQAWKTEKLAAILVTVLILLVILTL